MLLIPFLKDKTAVGKEMYSVKADTYEPRLPLRVCDEAALAIAAHCKDVSFKLEGSHENLDRQIVQLRKTLSVQNRLR